MKNTTVGWIIGVIAVIVIVIVLASQSSSSSVENYDSVSNIGYVDGEQQIAITAKGGYYPARTVADANVPTKLFVYTDGTYDCSSALTIPSLGYSDYLPASGVTEIVVPPQPSGTTLQGLCTMGMYRFNIAFN